MADEVFKYTGPGSCAAPACHGGVQPRHDTKPLVLQNEYSTWLLRDEHSHAFEVLSNDVGKGMARILGLKPETDEKCLVCHDPSIHKSRAASFKKKENEGVGCESCHGPASVWLGPHTEGDLHGKWENAYERAVHEPQGMVDTRNLIRRTELCLECHLGTSEKTFVDHKMIAAGHPDLFFELASFSARMPKHWDESREDPWRGVRTLGVGQAVQLREALLRLARRAQGPTWPEFAEMQCYACHHSLTAPKKSWRQARGYTGRRPGDVPWDMSRYAVFRILVHELEPSTGQRLDAELAHLSTLVSDLRGKPAEIAGIATTAARTADQLAHQIFKEKISQAMTLGLMQSISGDANRISSQDERAAEQAAMALDSLFTAYTRTATLNNQAQVKAAIQGLFHQFDDPSSYNASRFAGALKEINKLLGKLVVS